MFKFCTACNWQHTFANIPDNLRDHPKQCVEKHLKPEHHLEAAKKINQIFTEMSNWHTNI